MFEIEKNVPQPNWRHHSRLYPWPEMEDGDSFLVTGRTLNTMQATCRTASQRNEPKVFRARQQTDGIRIWRTS